VNDGLFRQNYDVDQNRINNKLVSDKEANELKRLQMNFYNQNMEDGSRDCSNDYGFRSHHSNDNIMEGQNPYPQYVNGYGVQNNNYPYVHPQNYQFQCQNQNLRQKQYCFNQNVYMIDNSNNINNINKFNNNPYNNNNNAQYCNNQMNRKGNIHVGSSSYSPNKNTKYSSDFLSKYSINNYRTL
jgi:hypothetical protein